MTAAREQVTQADRDAAADYLRDVELEPAAIVGMARDGIPVDHALSYYFARHRLSAPSDGYATAFYRIADMLGIGARTDSPAVVWERDMLPALKARLVLSDDKAARYDAAIRRLDASEARCLIDRFNERRKLRWSAPDKHGTIHQFVDDEDLASAVAFLERAFLLEGESHAR